MKSTPVICGIDLGSWSIKICVFSGDRFQILTNEANFRQTPSLVGYTPTERLMGQAALIKIKSNFSNTIRAPQRLLGLQRNKHLLDHLKYFCDQDIKYSVQGRQGQTIVATEEVLISLVNKIKNIVESHKLHLSLAFISVPTYYSQDNRFSLKKSAEIALNKPVRIIDDWISLGAHYAYTRLKQLKSLVQMRNIIFLDVGYSKFSISLVQFTQFQARLLDWEHLSYTGCRNMDNFVAEFYSEQFATKHHQVISNNPKAYAKLLDAVQKQRTVLSANTEYHLNLEYIMGEEDLTYNMNRQQFEDTIVSVLSDIASSMASFQSRNSSVPLHALQLMGGGSRIPCIQSMASKVFGLQPSRTLNQSQSIATGTAIIGSLQHKLINMPYSFDGIVARQISAKWNGQKRQLFWRNTKVPDRQVLNFGNEGTIDLVIYCEQGLLEKQIGRLKFKTPNKITFIFDINKILTAHASVSTFDSYQLYYKSQAKWNQFKERQQEMLKIDHRMGQLYQMKNDYQSQFYRCKSNFAELRLLASEEEIQEIQSSLERAEKWVEEEHHEHSHGSEKDLLKFQEKIKEIKTLRRLCDQVGRRKNATEQLRKKYETLTHQISGALDSPLNQKSQQKVLEVMNWGLEAYQQMQKSLWKGDSLTFQKIDEASVMLKTILRQ